MEDKRKKDAHHDDYYASLKGFHRAVPIILTAVAVFITICFITGGDALAAVGVVTVLRGIFVQKFQRLQGRQQIIVKPFDLGIQPAKLRIEGEHMLHIGGIEIHMGVVVPVRFQECLQVIHIQTLDHFPVQI